MSKIKPLARKTDIVLQEFGNETLVYDLKTNKAFNLNETSTLIWQACTGNKSVSEIALKLSEKFKSPIDEDFVWLALEQLKKDNLLENAAEVSTDFGGLSRREVIKKVGLGSLIALPLISSLVAPMATHAQSAAVCAAGRCRCPNMTDNCAGNATTPPTTGGPYVNCNTVGGTPTCDCVGPYGGNDSAGTGFRLGNRCASNP